MNVNLKPDPTPGPRCTVERGTIDGCEANVHTFDDGKCAATLRVWRPQIRQVEAWAPTRDEAIAEAVRMARACGMVAP